MFYLEEDYYLISGFDTCVKKILTEKGSLLESTKREDIYTEIKDLKYS